MSTPNSQQHRNNVPPQVAPLRQVKLPTGWIMKREPGQTPLPKYPHELAPFDDADVAAVKALNMGQATPDQQRRFVEFLAFMCNYGGPAYVPGDVEASHVWMGKQLVMSQLGQMARTVTRAQTESEQGT